MQCANHPQLEAKMRCDGCAEPFCSNCLVEVAGQTLCNACKVMAVKNRSRPPRPVNNKPVCREAYIALTLSIVGVVICCLSIILHPVAFFIAYNAVQRIRSSPNLGGIEVARAAQGISVLGLAINLIYLISIIVSVANDDGADY